MRSRAAVRRVGGPWSPGTLASLARRGGDGGMCLLSAAAGGGDATPIRLGGGAVIDSALNFVESGNNSEFLFEGNVSPDFGAGSFAAFRVSGDARGRITDTSR